MSVRKTTLTIDDDIIAAAAAILATHGIKETVDAALNAILVAEARREVVAQLVTMDGLDLDNAEVMAGAWRD